MGSSVRRLGAWCGGRTMRRRLIALLGQHALRETLNCGAEVPGDAPAPATARRAGPCAAVVAERRCPRAGGVDELGRAWVGFVAAANRLGQVLLAHGRAQATALIRSGSP
jgi:hypothetical protein